MQQLLDRDTENRLTRANNWLIDPEVWGRGRVGPGPVWGGSDAAGRVWGASG